MKQNFRSLLLIALTALTLSACQEVKSENGAVRAGDEDLLAPLLGDFSGSIATEAINDAGPSENFELTLSEDPSSRRLSLRLSSDLAGKECHSDIKDLNRYYIDKTGDRQKIGLLVFGFNSTSANCGKPLDGKELALNFTGGASEKLTLRVAAFIRERGSPSYNQYEVVGRLKRSPPTP